MKLRIRGQSLRLRLQKQDVERLLADGRLFEKTCIGPRIFQYGIESNKDGSGMTASFDGDRILIKVPHDRILKWAGSEELSLYGEHQSDASLLKILIEKDLMCIKPRTSPMWEDESDAFPNPNTACGGAHL